MLKILQRKTLTGITLTVIAAAGYFGYQGLNKDEISTRYSTATVEKGALIVSLSGSGQVSTSNQVEIKSKVSGEAVYVGVKNGQEVKAGTLLVQIDDRKAQKAVNDAETALETANLELEELLQPADPYSLLQAENSIIQARDNLIKLKFTQESKQQDVLDGIEKAEDNLEKAYEDGFNAITSAFLDLPTLITNLGDILYSCEIAKSEINLFDYSWNISIFRNSVETRDRDELEKFIEPAETNYKTARDKYDENFENYKNTSRYSDKETIEALLNETLETARAIAEAVKDETNMLDYWIDYQSSHNKNVYAQASEYQSDVKSYTSKANSHLSSLLSVQRNIKDNREAKLNAELDLIEMEQNNPIDLAAAERSIKEKEESLAKLKAEPDEIDVRAKKIAIQQKEDVLLDARQSLDEHYVRAPFNGIVASLNVKNGDSVSSNAIATFITKQKIAEITLNEIDIAQVKIGQKANIFFDAVEDLSITGEVIEVDVLGTASQGVVTYGVKIAFDTQDARIKPGMTVSANIIIDVRQNVLMVQSSAIKQQGDIFYAQKADNSVIQESNLNAANISGIAIPTSNLRIQQIDVGLSNDTMTEIINGLEQGDIVITQTITSNSASTQSQQNSGGFNPSMMRMMR